MRIYMDNCCLNRPFDDQSDIRIRLEAEAVLYIQMKVINKELELAWSYIIEYENKFNPFEEKRSAIDVLKSYAVIDTGETEEICKNALLIQKLGAKTFDPLHIACAIETKCDYFISTDNLLLRKLVNFDKMKVINPIQFINVLEGE